MYVFFENWKNENYDFGFLTNHCEAGEGYWLQGEAALQAHSFRDADPQPVIPKKESGWNGLEIATNDRNCLKKSVWTWTEMN